VKGSLKKIPTLIHPPPLSVWSVCPTPKKFLKKNQMHILKLKEMLKKQEESKKTQLEEKEEDIKTLKNEIEEHNKVDDEISKSLEVNVNLKTQIEEAKRIEEL
jgi:hypothetical protein